jgi:hypothetical protein
MLKWHLNAKRVNLSNFPHSANKRVIEIEKSRTPIGTRAGEGQKK